MLALDLQDPEEAASVLTHGAGAAASAVGGAALVVLAAAGDTYQLLAAAIYSLSLVALYAASTLFHLERDPVAKARLELVDHCAIFVLIAGSYTPFLLVTLRESVGLPMMAAIWGLAAAGVIFKLVVGTRFRIASTLIYLAMGWLIVLVAGPMLQALPPMVSGLLLAGGLAYSAGTYFFCNERIPFCHAIWHVFVLAGSACHFIAVATQVIAT